MKPHHIARSLTVLIVADYFAICWTITGPIWSALGQDQQYMKVDKEVIAALMKLTEERGITQNVKDALAKFVCLLYCPKGIHVTSIPDPRRYVLQTSGTKQQSASYS